MDDMFTPMYGNVFTVFDYILMLLTNLGTTLQGLLSTLGGLVTGFLP